MRNTKLYHILREFNKIEQNRLRKFLVSPYFNANDQITDLFEIMIKDIGKDEDSSFEKEDIWEKMNLNAAFDDVRFRKYCSDLLKLIEGFLSQEIIEENKLQKSVSLLQAVRNKKLEKLYSSSLRTARKLVEQNPYYNAEGYLFSFQVERSEYEISESELRRVDKSNIESISNNLDIFYISEKLKYYSSVLTQQQYVKHDYELFLIEEIFKWVGSSPIKEEPPVSIYYQICLTTLEPEDLSHYDKLKELLTKYSTHFPKNEALTQYYSAANYCIRKINTGKRVFNQELFNLFKEMVEKGVVVSDYGEVSPWDFKNIIQNSLFLKEYEWTENFIREYGEKIPEQYRKNAVTFNLGQLYFYQKKYEDVLDQLRNVEYDDITYSLNSKAFLTWAYLELDEIELLMFHIESFRTFINRHKDIHGNRKKRYLHFLKFAKKLSKLFPGDSKTIQKIRSELEIAKAEGVVGINWIREKLAELES
jgi:hypothetical protein